MKQSALICILFYLTAYYFWLLCMLIVVMDSVILTAMAEISFDDNERFHYGLMIAKRLYCTAEDKIKLRFYSILPRQLICVG
jgi:hypothetical protein